MRLSQFGSKLDAHMKMDNLTQRCLSEFLGTTQQTISRWLKGTHEPSFDLLIKIAHFFNTTPDELLGFDEITDEMIDAYDWSRL